MAFLHGKSTGVLFNATNLGVYLNDASSNSTVETAETTTFSNSAKTYIPGLKDGTISLSGMFDGDAGAIDPIMAAALGVDDAVTTVGLGGFTAGNRSILAKVDQTSYDISAPVGDVVSASVELQADGGIDHGICLVGLNAVTATGNGTSQDNSTSSSNGGVAHLHLITNTHDGTTTIKVQHSADNSTWADLVTFAGVATTITSQERVVVAAATTVNRYLRATHTLAGSTGGVTYHVSFARR